MQNLNRSSLGIARALVAGLVASLLVLVSPLTTESKADYTSFTPYTNDAAISYSNRVCDLGDPNDHSTSATAFEISTSEQLWEITDCVSNSATIFFELGDDIDVSEASTAPTNSPIGYSTSGDISFSGVLDGKDKMISGLAMSTNSYGVGLFAYLNNATVSNLAISGSFTTTKEGFNVATNSAGALAIRAGGAIELISISNHADVTGKLSVGGLIGWVGTGTTQIVDSLNTGTITADTQKSGGLVGEIRSTADKITVLRSINSGAIASAYAGGGLIGLSETETNIEDSSNTADVDTGTQNASGGLIGRLRVGPFSITSSFNTGDVLGSRVGGLVGEVNSGDLRLHSSYNIGDVTGATGNGTGGLVGLVGSSADLHVDSSFNSGNVLGRYGSIYQARIGGLIGYTEQDVSVSSSFNVGSVTGGSYVGGILGYSDGFPANISITASYNAGIVSGSSDVDGLLGLKLDSGNVLTSSAYSSVDSDYVTTSTVADMKLASTYVGFDFSSSNPVWGFGSPTDNQGFPMLRVFNQVGTYFTAAPGSNSISNPNQTQSPGSTQSQNTPAEEAPAPVYSGPVIGSAPAAAAGSEVRVTGSRMDTVTSAFAGDVELVVVSATSGELVLEIPSSLAAGTYDLVIQSSFGTLTFQQGLTVEAAEPVVEPESDDRKLTVGTFRGYVAIYTQGYEGQKLSAKVAGKWLVVPELDESWRGNNHSRTVRLTGAGYDILVHLYIDGEFIRTQELTTR